MKLIAVTILFHPLLILGFSALALSTNLGTDAISHSGFHGLTQVVYGIHRQLRITDLDLKD